MLLSRHAGQPCGGDAAAAGLCGPRYYELFDDIVPASSNSGVADDSDVGGQFAFGAQQYGYPASPEAFNATCQKAGWAHLPDHPCMNATNTGFRDPAQEGESSGSV